MKITHRPHSLAGNQPSLSKTIRVLGLEIIWMGVRGVSGFLIKESGCRGPSGEFHKSKSTLFLLSLKKNIQSTQVTDLQHVDFSLVWN